MPGVKRVYESDGEDLDQETTSESEISNSGDTDSTSEICNNEDTESTSGFSSGGDGDDVDNDDDNRSSVMDDEECEKRLKDCLSQMTELENEFIRLKDELKKFWKENKMNMRLMKRLCGDYC